MKPSQLQEDQHLIYKESESSYHMYHVAHGILWETWSEDPGSFEPPNAEEINRQTADQNASSFTLYQRTCPCCGGNGIDICVPCKECAGSGITYV